MKRKNLILVAMLIVASVLCMGAYINDPTSGTGLKVDTTSGAGRVSIYDGTGSPIYPTYTSIGMVEARVRQSAATAANNRVWAVWNSSATKTVVITRAKCQMFFDGTAAATLMKYDFEKVTAVTAFSGGVVVNPILKRTGLGAPVSTTRVLDTGLTLTGATTQGMVEIGAQGRVTQTTTAFSSTIFEVDFADDLKQGVELQQNEALAIKNNVVSVIGDNIYCTVHYFER
jgi:hypothetical protein